MYKQISINGQQVNVVKVKAIQNNGFLKMEKRKVPNAVFKAFEKTQQYKQAFIDAEKEIERNHKNGIFSEGDPNHPMYNNGYNYATQKYSLFGHDQDEFLAKQYK